MLYFKPVREDGRSYRDVAVDFLKDKQPETVVSYKDLGRILHLDWRSELQKIQAAVHAANTVLLKLHNRGVKTITRVGYRILPAREHHIIAGGHENRATKQMSRALAFYRGTNLAEMTEVERRLHQGQHMLAEAIMASHRQVNRRMDRIESLLKGGETINSN